MKKIQLLLIITFSFSGALAQTISTFESPGEWKIVKSEGAEINVLESEGFSGKGFMINYRFTGAGWCGIEKPVNISLTKDYKFTFYTKGISPLNNLEFKLIDSTGDNVWWLNQRNFRFPENWEKQAARKRNIQFAWGPAGGGVLHTVKTIQIIIAASEGGEGTVYFDELQLNNIIIPDSNIVPLVTSSTSGSGTEPSFIMDNDFNTRWRNFSSGAQQIKIDLGNSIESQLKIIPPNSLIYPKSIFIC